MRPREGEFFRHGHQCSSSHILVVDGRQVVLPQPHAERTVVEVTESWTVGGGAQSSVVSFFGLGTLALHVLPHPS